MLFSRSFKETFVNIVVHFQEELKHRKRQTLAETYNFAEENSGTAGASRASDIVPYDQ